MNRGHGVAHGGAQNAQKVQKWQKIGKMKKIITFDPIKILHSYFRKKCIFYIYTHW